jgi:hypothetical protein
MKTNAPPFHTLLISPCLHKERHDLGGPNAPRPVLSDDVVFLYKAMPGTCADSFGLHCAMTADVPDAVIARARLISECVAQGRVSECGLGHESLIRRGLLTTAGTLPTGRPVPRAGSDSLRDMRRDEAVASLVDGFLEYGKAARDYTYFDLGRRRAAVHRFRSGAALAKLFSQVRLRLVLGHQRILGPARPHDRRVRMRASESPALKLVDGTLVGWLR